MTEAELEGYMKKYYACVYSAALCCCKNPADADDTAQEVFLKLYLYNGTFAGEEHIKAWLIKCAVNRSINLLRSYWYRFSRPLDAAVSKTADSESDSLLYCIERLEKKNRIAMYLYYYEGYSTKETADILGISEAAVRSRIARGKKQLKKIIESEETDL